jgi:hypothetical protein
MATMEQDYQRVIADHCAKWHLEPFCPKHDRPVERLHENPSEVRQCAYGEVTYECGCTYRRTPFALTWTEKL